MHVQSQTLVNTSLSNKIICLLRIFCVHFRWERVSWTHTPGIGPVFWCSFRRRKLIGSMRKWLQVTQQSSLAGRVMYISEIKSSFPNDEKKKVFFQSVHNWGQYTFFFQTELEYNGIIQETACQLKVFVLHTKRNFWKLSTLLWAEKHHITSQQSSEKQLIVDNSSVNVRLLPPSGAT